jgi:hypothetical protein
MTVHHQDDCHDDKASATRVLLPQRRPCLLQGVNANRPRSRPQPSCREEGETRPRQSIAMMTVMTTRQAQHECLCLNNALAYCKASTRTGCKAVRSLSVEKKAKHVDASPSPRCPSRRQGKHNTSAFASTTPLPTARRQCETAARPSAAFSLRRRRNTSTSVHHHDDRRDDEASTTHAPLPQQRPCLLQGVHANRPRGRPQLSRREEGETRCHHQDDRHDDKASTTRVPLPQQRPCLLQGKASTQTGREAIRSLPVEKKAKRVHVSPSPR